METKQIKIEVPQGYEIDREKSTFENIILKPIELPLSVDEILNRNWGINTNGFIFKSPYHPTKSSLSTETRAKAFLALMQLVELRDAWNGEWKADWENGEEKHSIIKYKNKISNEPSYNYSYILSFKTQELAKKFLAQFKDLIEEAKELI